MSPDRNQKDTILGSAMWVWKPADITDIGCRERMRMSWGMPTPILVRSAMCYRIAGGWPSNQAWGQNLAVRPATCLRRPKSESSRAGGMFWRATRRGGR